MYYVSNTIKIRKSTYIFGIGAVTLIALTSGAFCLLKLEEKDLRLLLTALIGLNSDFDPKTLPSRALSFLESIVSSDCSSFDFFTSDNSYDTTAWTDRPDISTPENMSVFAEYVHEHELIPIALAKRDGMAMKMTDVLSQERFERTGLFNEFYRLHGLNRQIGLALPVSHDLTVSCVATKGGKDFTERDRAMMSLAAPQVLNAMRNAIAYGRMEKALESGGSGIVALDSNGRLVFANDLITELIAAYFPHDVKDAKGLPETVTRWMGKRSLESEFDVPIQPFVIEGRSGVLKIRLMINTLSREHNLIFEEKRLPRLDQSFQSVDLTKREAEILFWITNGKTNAVIAEICNISMRTVHKHVEHIYQKLGVETRTAAMLRGLEVM